MNIKKNIDYILGGITSFILFFILVIENRDYKLGLIVALFIFFNIMIVRHYKNKKLLLELNNQKELKNDFLSNLSHEMRTLLNGIDGFSDLIINSNELKGEQKENIEIIKSNADELLTLIVNSIDRESLRKFDSDRGILIDLKSTKSNDIEVLIVDDVTSTRKILQNILKNNNIKSDIVSSGEKAIEKIINKNYDIIFMDINLETINGIETTQKIRYFEKENKIKHVPIVAITALTSKGDKENILKGGLDFYLSKPISVDDIKKVINKFINLEYKI